MKIYQDNKNGERTSPEFERESDFLIPVGLILVEIEECSNKENVNEYRMTNYKEGKTHDN
jgi:hypothetical protein